MDYYLDPANPIPPTPQLSGRKPKSSTGMDQHTLIHPLLLRCTGGPSCRSATLLCVVVVVVVLYRCSVVVLLYCTVVVVFFSSELWSWGLHCNAPPYSSWLLLLLPYSIITLMSSRIHIIIL